MRLDSCPLCTYEPYLMCRRTLRVASRPRAISPYHHMDMQCGLSVSRLLWWPQLTLKLLVNKSGLKLRLALAGKYQLTVIGLWGITAVGTRIVTFSTIQFQPKMHHLHTLELVLALSRLPSLDGKKNWQVEPVKFKMARSPCLCWDGLYSLLVNYFLWRGKLTQIYISKHYELSHFPCPPVKRELKE